MEDLLAPCGIDCSHCRNYLNSEHDLGTPHCKGCRARDKHCGFLKQKCEPLREKKVRFCYECADFPCENLERLERNYNKHGYLNSFIENNRRIKEVGEEKFFKENAKRLTCPECKGEISIHDKVCVKCGRRADALH